MWSNATSMHRGIHVRGGSPSHWCHLTDTSGRQPVGCVSHCGFYILVLCPCGLPLRLVHCCWTQYQASLPYNERIKRRGSFVCGVFWWTALSSEHARIIVPSIVKRVQILGSKKRGTLIQIGTWWLPMCQSVSPKTRLV